ncbi:MAG TPA: hypothetical protein VNO30_27645 [Kofleriaceae bacterium]|nr:hypothetical protein [Kofleriaceae bacterium]
MTKRLMMKAKTLLAAVAVFAVLGTASAVESATYVDYWGDNLFLGLAYHRFGCFNDDAKTLSDQDYDGFTTNRYCYTNAAWDAPGAAGHTYLDWNYASSKSQLDSCGTVANNTYGTPNYAARSNTCSYNILTNCNSDCWIRRFSSCQGYQIGIASPCF